MSFEEAIANTRDIPSLPVMPDLQYLRTAKNKVFEKWPDIIVEAQADEQEEILKKMHGFISNEDWSDVKLSFVLKAFRVAFLEKFQTHPIALKIISFAIGELAVSTNPTLMNSFASIYLSTFNAKSVSTIQLAQSLKKEQTKLSNKWQIILREFEGLFLSKSIAKDIAQKMDSWENPFLDLKDAGFVDPFSAGLMEFVHEEYLEIIGQQISVRSGFERLLRWINPEPGKVKQTGNVQVIEAVLKPWLKSNPEDKFMQYITEKLIIFYEDPRIRLEKWLGVSEHCMDVIFSWLTKEDLRFFTSVVDATTKENMWPKRRNYWLKLYDRGKITQAWVAFCPSAARIATQKLSASGTQLSQQRFGKQTGRNDTSILIMKVGNKIFVDGCHNYSTHVWNVDDPVAPRLFKSRYDCDYDVRLKSAVGKGKSHISIPSWIDWVEKKIFERIPMSKERPINWDSPNRNFTSEAHYNKANRRASINDEASNYASSSLFRELKPSPEGSISQPIVSSASQRHTRKMPHVQRYDPSEEKYDVDLELFKDELRNLKLYLPVIEQGNFALSQVISAGLEDRPLKRADLDKLKILFEQKIITPDSYPVIFRSFQPIFKRRNKQPDYEKWALVVGNIENHGIQYRILSTKSSAAIQKLKLNNWPLSKEEINSFEYLLQTLRAHSISFDDLFK